VGPKIDSMRQATQVPRSDWGGPVDNLVRTGVHSEAEVEKSYMEIWTSALSGTDGSKGRRLM
jgi:hypothetical protein